MFYKLLVFATLISLLSACSNEVQEANDQIVIESITRSAPDAEAAAESSYFSNASISKKWSFGDDFIDLDENGLFSAMLNGEMIEGKWGFTVGTEEMRILKLEGHAADAETKEVTFKESYELINLSFDRMLAVDSKGNKVNFFSEKK